jgi:hypothetical protein
MVVKIMSGTDIKGALNYNERKVEAGMAVCIQASMFWKDPHKLTFFDKINRFKELNEKNLRTKTNTLHISLNFAMAENLSVDNLNAIASAYMDRIGFGEQPFLVYEHRDAAHQHVHILTTMIQEDGKRIPINFLGKYKSEKARKQIEKEFHLVPASKGQMASASHDLELRKAVYGNSETFRSISNIVRTVIRGYKYTSIPELNAALQQYNILADRGSEKSQMFAKQGLLYWMTTDEGKKIGIPVKASRIYGKPTMSFLEKQFRINEALRNPHKDILRAAIDQIFQFKIKDRDHFIRELANYNIHAVFRINPEGRVYGLTFVDNRTKCVFKGSDLGKSYSANAIQMKFGVVPLYPGGSKESRISKSSASAGQVRGPGDTTKHANLLEELMKPEMDYSSGNVFKRKRKKKRRIRR